MPSTIDLNSSGIMVRDRDGTSKQLSQLVFPSDHQIVILDAEVKKADQKHIPRIPLSFQIRYNGAAEDPPAVVLLINPTTMNVSKSKKVNAEFTRGGHVVEEWGDMQESLQFSGKIGGYYVLNPTVGLSGLNRYHRSKSPSFKNLMNLFMIYRNNGMIYDKTVQDPNAQPNRLIKDSGLASVSDRIPKMVQNARNRIAIVGDIYLSYDGVSYKGSFDEFSIEENADSPYNLSYKFTFIVQSKIEVDKRNLETYSQRNIELGDLSRKQPSTTQIKQLNQMIERGLQVSDRAALDEATSLSQPNSTIINPATITTGQQITKTNVIDATTRDQISFLNSQGLKTDSEDISRLRQDLTRQSSTSSSEANKGFNDSVLSHKEVLIKNHQPDNSQTNARAVGLATEAKRNLLEKQKIAK